MSIDSKDPATASSNRATHLLNPHNLLHRLTQRLQRLTIGAKAQQPVHTDAIAQQLEALVYLKRLELLVGLEDKHELREHMDDSLTLLGTDLDTQQSIRLLHMIVEQRRQRLNGEPVQLKKDDLLATRD